MTNKTLFCTFYVNFCTFCASLWPKRTVFTRQKTSMISVNPVILSDFFVSEPVLSEVEWICGKIIPEISVNSWLINNLRASNALYNCKETFTDVNKTLQIKLFMQNKANFQKVKLDVNEVLTRGYVQMDTWSIRTTKPIQSQLKPIQSQLKPILCQNKANQSQFQRQKNAALHLYAVGGRTEKIKYELETTHISSNES